MPAINRPNAAKACWLRTRVDGEASREHADRAEQQVGAQRDVAELDRHVEQRLERDGSEIHDTDAGRRLHGEKGEARQNRPGEQQLAPVHHRALVGARLGGVVRPVGEILAQHEESDGDHESQCGSQEESAAPADQRLREQDRRRSNRAAEQAGKGVDRKRAAHALAGNVVRKERVVGRVVDRVAESGQREHGDQEPVGMNEADEREGDRAQHQPGDQHCKRADPVRQQAGRRLKDRRDDSENGEGNCEPGVAEAVFGLHEDEQRRQHQEIEVADEMRRAHARDHARFGGIRRRKRQLW